ncbi:hypothetical protein [Candidatus Mycobacterium methanotrophicum]|uniref:Uncharacterized protein n=1 Tax=Candidatus Mycobacterium methanotrophicum TaxID=2943498 RepID=A0ABY4QP50_9MYCO|nr:hypothetical protein [Candidatus Mycobacterium methanotrophicum]UQX12022.1 hypothetical protein M5I08_06665 [Candidatus Mycobacterium methanotrophicum]
MSQSPESEIDSEVQALKPNRLRRALTWVGIVAGAVVIVGAIFVAGAAMGWLPAGHDHHGQQPISVAPEGWPADGPGRR